MKRRSFLKLIAIASIVVSSRVVCQEPPSAEWPEPESDRWDYEDLTLNGVPIVVVDDLGHALTKVVPVGKPSADGKRFITVDRGQGDYLNGRLLHDLLEAGYEALWA